MQKVSVLLVFVAAFVFARTANAVSCITTISEATSCTRAAAGQPPTALHSLIELSDPLGRGWTVADLDGDGETDILVSRQVGQTDRGYLYRVALKLSDSEGPSSFTFENTDALGVNIASVDLDADADLDLVISERFSLKTIGVWVNNGKGYFTRRLPGLSSSPPDLSLARSLRVDVPTQAIEENVWRRLYANIPRADFVELATFPSQAEFGTVVDCRSRPPDGTLHLRAPPTLL